MLIDETLQIYDGFTGNVISMLRLPESTCFDWCPGRDKIMIARGCGVIIKDSTLHTDYGHFDHLFVENPSRKSLSSLLSKIIFRDFSFELV